MRRTKWGLFGLGLIMTLGACSSSGHSAASATSSTTAGPAPSTTSAASTPSSSSSTSSSVAPFSSTTTASGPGSNRCQTSALAGALTGENGTAGSVYYTLQLTNRGSTPCVLEGWPGVSFVTSPSGPQVGAPAARIPGSSPAVTLRPGTSAGAVLQITEATNFGSDCRVTAVSGLKVFPPNQTASLYVVHTDHACANTTDVTLHVGAFQVSS